jgi:hypothetical protein
MYHSGSIRHGRPQVHRSLLEVTVAKPQQGTLQRAVSRDEKNTGAQSS